MEGKKESEDGNDNRDAYREKERKWTFGEDRQQESSKGNIIEVMQLKNK